MPTSSEEKLMADCRKPRYRTARSDRRERRLHAPWRRVWRQTLGEADLRWTTLLAALAVATVARAQAPQRPPASPPPPAEAASPTAATDDEIEHTSDAPADPTRAAYDAFVLSALRAFGEGRFREAADDFRAAYALRASARALRGLGKALYELGDYVGASEALERSLVTELDLLGDGLRVEVEELLARSERQVAVVTLRTNVDASVVIDGREVVARTVRVNPGTLDVTATASGFEPVRREVRVVAGERVDVRLELERRAPARVEVREEPPSPAPIVGGVIAVVGVGALAGGAFWLADRNDARRECRDRVGVTCTNSSRIATERRAAVTTLALGATAAVVGAALIVLGRRAHDDESVRALCGPEPRGASCFWMTRF